MTPEEQAAKTAADEKAAADEAAKKAADDAAKNPPQDPLKAEAERVKKNKEGKTELEKAIFTRNKIDERIKELGGNPEEAIIPEDADDNTPVTVGMLKKRDQDKAAKTALSLATEQIPDQTELELVKHHLENSIKPSGNAQEDLAKARAIVNGVKNAQIAEEALRRQDPKRNTRASGAPSTVDDQFVPTAAEEVFMKSFKLSEDDIKKARKAEADLKI